MKKVGQFFFIFVPFLLAFGMQFLAAFYTMGISILTDGMWILFSKDVSFTQILPDISEFFTQNGFSTAMMLIYALLAVAVFGLWYYIKYDGVYLISPGKVFRPLSVFGILLLVPGGQFVTSYIISFTSLLFPKWLEDYEKLLENAGLNNTTSFLMLCYAVLIGPIAEELIFRGVTMRQAEKILPFWAANLLQALVFGTYHMNMLQGVYAFFVGLLLGYVCHRGKIHSSILLHILFNAWGLILSRFLTLDDSPIVAILLLAATIVCFSGGIISFYFGTRKICAEADA